MFSDVGSKKEVEDQITFSDKCFKFNHTIVSLYSAVHYIYTIQLVLKSWGANPYHDALDFWK